MTQPVGAGAPVNAGASRVLMLGKGWFPDDLGGLDRYYRGLFEHLPEASGVVVGPGRDVPPRAVAVSATDAGLGRRLVAFSKAAAHAGETAEVIDAHFALYAFWPVVVGALRRWPLVVHFQGPWADENVAAGDRSRLSHLARRRLESAVYRRADTVITLTSAFRRVVVERYGVSPWRVRVERPGVDVEHFVLGDRMVARAALGLDSAAFVVVCVRRLVPRMGIETLLDAWEEAGAPGALLVAGDGPLREVLADRIAASPELRRTVQLLGRVAEDILPELYRAADVNIVPTAAFEGFGLVVLEAAACGTTSIVTDAGGLPEAVNGAPGSRVLPTGDAAALATVLGALTARGSTVSRQSLRAWAQQDAWPTVAARHRRLLRETVERDDMPRPMRVVVLDHVAKLSGGEIALLRLLPHLRDVAVHVVLAEDGPLVGRFDLAGVSTQVLPLAASARDLRRDAVRPGRIPLRAAIASAVYVLRLARLLRQQRPDLVHANTLKSGVYGGLAARLVGIPLLWHLHDRLDPEYLPPAAVRLMRLAIAELATSVIANSRSTAATVRHGSNVFVVPSALPSELPAAHVPRRRGRLVFGMVGRLTPWKGQHVFLDAFAKAFPQRSHDAVLIGAPLFGEERYADELRAQGKRSGIYVEFRGFREDIWAELGRLDVLVHASTTPEPFGQVVQEGMAAGLPVVAANTGGPAEFVTDGLNGVLVPRNDPAALAVALRRVAGDAELRGRLGRAARESSASFAPELVAEQVRNVYHTIVGSRGTRHVTLRRRRPGVA